VAIAKITEPDALADFTATPFTAVGLTRTVYRLGRGPGVILMHELPGLTPECANLARTLAADGYAVFCPSLCGTPGKPFTAGYAAAVAARLCVAREFAVFAARSSGTIADFLRALCRAAHAELGGPGVGVIGMCLTGNFALALMADPSVAAPVASQPSLPLSPDGNALHLSDDELVAIRARAAAGTRVIGLRFSHDRLCPPARFDRLTAELGDAFERIEIDSSPRNPHGHRRLAHSVLTFDLVDADGQPTRAALDRVRAFLRERLRA
jgi:dienelactone hydrolase